jgi:DNA-binding LytR/AlgR family response regulator
MKAIIIEDEQLAAQRLESMIKSYDAEIEIVAKIESVCESIIWFRENKAPDLIFLDIHLEDGISFTIFDEVKVKVPIIFTTAFDEYAIKAFKLKSIDYLLKPIVQEDLNKALEKYKEWGNDNKTLIDVKELYSLMQTGSKSYRERYAVTSGTKLKTIEVKDIVYFFSTSGITFVVMNDKHQYSLDQSLDSLINELDPKLFFRVNRQFLIALKGIANVHIFPKSRLKLELNPPQQEEVYVSIDKVPDFKRWLDGEK